MIDLEDVVAQTKYPLKSLKFLVECLKDEIEECYVNYRDCGREESFDKIMSFIYAILGLLKYLQSFREECNEESRQNFS